MAEPTVGGLTGAQHLQLRLWQDPETCKYEYYPADAQGPAERCTEDDLDDDGFCEDHEIKPEPDYDSLNKDRAYE